jgi:hypothetical protein
MDQPCSNESSSFRAQLARDGIRRLLREAVDAFTDPKNPGGCYSNQALMSCATATKHVQRQMQKLTAGFDASLSNRFERAKAAGELTAPMSAHDLARCFSVVFQGLGLRTPRRHAGRNVSHCRHGHGGMAWKRLLKLTNVVSCQAEEDASH